MTRSKVVTTAPHTPKPKKICAICGVAPAATVDHVPPRSVFNRPLPRNMITVPACTKCNNGANVQDERFRVYLALSTLGRHDQATQLWRERAIRTLENNLRLQREIFPNMQRVNVRDALGRESERIRFLWPAACYNETLERIARGLAFHHFGTRHGAAVGCEVSMLTTLPVPFYEITDIWHRGGIGDDAFVYRYAEVKGHPLRTFWVFQFYNSHWGTVEFFPAGEGPVAGLEPQPDDDE